MTTWRQVLAMEAKIGPAADSDGIDVVWQQMIDAASVEGGPIVPARETTYSVAMRVQY